MKCIIESELTPSRFSEMGEPYRIFHDRNRGLVAIASQMPHLGYPGHWLFPDASPAAHRLGIYNQRDGTMLGCIPTKYPINDVCFSPDGENVVIATGSYDGGWCFEGYLLRFFYPSARLEQLLGQCREVSACRYESDGSITALIRPDNEEEFAEEGMDAWSIVQCVKIGTEPNQWGVESPESPREDARLTGLPPTVPSDHGFHHVILNPTTDQRRSWQQEAIRWLGEVGGEILHRHLGPSMDEPRSIRSGGARPSTRAAEYPVWDPTSFGMPRQRGRTDQSPISRTAFTCSIRRTAWWNH